MTETTDEPDEPALVDRSRHVLGLEHCEMARFFQYHYADIWDNTKQDRGIVPSTPSPDLIFGAAMHLTTEFLFKAEKVMGKVPEAALSEWVELVANKVDKALRGTREGIQARTELVFLYKALSKAFYHTYYPWITDRYHVVDVEREEVTNYPGAGIRFMSKPDLVLRSKAHGRLVIPDFKTAKVADEREMKQYITSVQHMSGALGVEARLQEDVASYMVFFLLKGLKRAEYNTDTKSYDGPVTYNSPLVWGYYDPVRDDWQPKYSYKAIGRGGKVVTKAIGKGYVRTFAPTDYPGGLDAWLKFLLESHTSVVWESFAMAGEYPIDRVLLDKFVNGMLAYEQRWQAKMNAVEKDYAQLDLQVSRSWDCHRFGYECPYLNACKHPKNLIDELDVQWRRPHHEEELKRFAEKHYHIPKPLLDITVPDLSKINET